MELRRQLMARWYDRMMRGYEREAASLRASLLAGVLPGSRVLELGPGTGVNFEYLPDLEQLEWCGVEPSGPMRAQLRQRVGQPRPSACASPSSERGA